MHRVVVTESRGLRVNKEKLRADLSFAAKGRASGRSQELEP